VLDNVAAASAGLPALLGALLDRLGASVTPVA